MNLGIKRKPVEEEELQLTPIMNVFLIIIPFLLMTASFVQMAILELNLPNLGGRRSQASQTEQKAVIINLLMIKETGFELKSPDLQFSPIPRQGNQYSLNGLKAELGRIKGRYQDSEDIIIQPESTIKYELIIHVMDTCREAGFPNISISAG